MQKNKKYILILILILLIFTTCKKEIPIQQKLIGSWEIKLQYFTFLFNFETEGKWTYEKFLGANSEEKIELITGQWEYDEKEKVLKLLPTEISENPEDGLKWEIDKQISFEITEVTQENLKIKASTGEVKDFKKRDINIEKKEGGKEGKETKESEGSINFNPIIVNLSRNKRYPQNRFLCIKFLLDLKDSKITKIHPKITESIMFYLSSLTYDDVKTTPQIISIKEDLNSLIEPYFKDKIKKFLVRTIVVTGNKKTANEFIDMYTTKAGEGKEKEKKGEKEDKEDEKKVEVKEKEKEKEKEGEKDKKKEEKH